MRLVVIILGTFLSLNLSALELNADQLESLSECDYFKYSTCTAKGLTIGACVKAEYDGFVKACGKVHADKFTYSREMFKPTLDPKKKNKQSCEATEAKLCGSAGLSVTECISKFGKEMSAACGKEFMEGVSSKEAKKYDQCFSLRKKECGNEIDPDCDARFKAKAPDFCKSPIVKSKSAIKGAPSEARLMNDCSAAIASKCKLDEKEILKEGVDTSEYLRKYQQCVKRAVKSASGKCGQHFETESKIKEAQN